jgi:hypothetical protein
MKTAHAIACSDHKSRDTTSKHFAGRDVIGCAFDGSLAKDGNPGSLSDLLGTEAMNLLDCVSRWLVLKWEKIRQNPNSPMIRTMGAPARLRQ